MNSDKSITTPSVTEPNVLYVVYDIDGSKLESSREMAFIEQRMLLEDVNQEQNPDEIYFASLGEAKVYVNDHYLLGGEYFSSKQLHNPDNLVYFIADKLTYMLA